MAAQDAKQQDIMPTSEAIAQLPRRACIGFAARLARRALGPLVRQAGPELDRITELLTRLVMVAEHVAAGKPAAEASVRRAYDEARAISEGAASQFADSCGQTYPVAGVVADVAEVVEYAIKAALVDTPAERARQASNAAYKTRQAAAAKLDGTYDREVFDRALISIRADFDRLSNAARQLHWSDGVCVPAEFFAAM